MARLRSTAAWFLCLLFISRFAEISAERSQHQALSRASRLARVLGEDFNAVRDAMFQFSEDLEAHDADSGSNGLAQLRNNLTQIVQKDCPNEQQQFNEACGQFAKRTNGGSDIGLLAAGNFLAITRALERANKAGCDNFKMDELVKIRSMVADKQDPERKQAVDSVKPNGETPEAVVDYLIRTFDASMTGKAPKQEDVKELEQAMHTNGKHRPTEKEAELAADEMQSRAEGALKAQEAKQGVASSFVGLMSDSRGNFQRVRSHRHLTDGEGAVHTAFAKTMQTADSIIQLSKAKLDELLDSGSDEEVRRFARALFFGEKENEADELANIIVGFLKGLLAWAIVTILCLVNFIIAVVLGVVVCLLWQITTPFSKLFGYRDSIGRFKDCFNPIFESGGGAMIGGAWDHGKKDQNVVYTAVASLFQCLGGAISYGLQGNANFGR